MGSHIEWLGLSLADFCNLGCIYCSVSARGEGSLLDHEKGKAFFEFFSGLSIPDPKVTLSGGEPTLHPKVTGFVRSAEENFIDPDVFVVTNGVMSAEKLGGLLETSATVNVTFEGLPEIHDRERPLRGGGGSSGQVLKTIRTVVREDPHRLLLRMNYSANKFGREEEIAGFLASLGVERVSVELLYPWGRGADYENVDLLGGSKRLPLLNRALRERGLDIGDSKSVPHKSPLWPTCGAGKSSFFLTVDGRVVTCQNILVASELPRDKEIFVVGEVDGNARLDKDKLDRFTKFAYDIPEMCSVCRVRGFCDGCPLERRPTGRAFPESKCELTRSRAAALGGDRNL